MKKLALAVCAGITFTSAVTALVGTSNIVVAAAAFKDVSSTHWAKASIDAAVNKGYLKGYSDGTFRPNAPVTRAEFAAILSRISTNQVVDGKGSFADLKGNWSEQEVTKALGMGFMSPSDYPGGFKPSTQLTRREMAKWMASGLASAQEDFHKALEDTKDTLVPVAEYYKGGLDKVDYPYVSVALGTGLMNGYEDGSFGTAKTTTRAEVAAILSRYEEVQKKEASSFRDLNEMREVGLTGTNLTSATDYEYVTIKATGVVADFNQVRDQAFKLRNNLGTQTLHRMIVVDATTDKKPKNLYGKMFIDKKFTGFVDAARYNVFIETTVTPSGDNLNNLAFANANGDRLLSGSNFTSGALGKYGVNALPEDEYVMSGFFRKGKIQRFWMEKTISKQHAPDMRSEGITINGKHMLFYIPE
ncbi:S-layer homology domain-containing protein [Paenibacillus massiliensis]|uniref:S-layer homology domain-containing protein n=1 Tax=Paenibacillus massiliensis TaxID=225917 RepID=UPI0004719CD1|nr:S-layer homology domain-containing protein [Paenibacillus massiliensis]